MAIETLDDWNQRLAACGCCLMPTCAAPPSYVWGLEIVQVESQGYKDNYIGVPFDLSLWRNSMTFRYESNLTARPTVVDPDGLGKVEYEGGSAIVFWDQTWPNGYRLIRCGAYVEPWVKINTYGGSYTFTRKGYSRASTEDPWTLNFTSVMVTTKTGLDTSPTWERVYNDDDPTFENYTSASISPYTTSDEVEVKEGTKSYEAWKADASGELTFSGCYTSGNLTNPNLVQVSTVINPPNGWTAQAYLRRDKARFRFRVPNSHLGNTYKLTYDIAEYPTVGDPFIVSEDHVIEWIGPGSGASSDPSWLSPWSEPFESSSENSGVRKVVNVRYSCYTSTRYGSKPQITGIGLAAP